MNIEFILGVKGKMSNDAEASTKRSPAAVIRDGDGDLEGKLKLNDGLIEGNEEEEEVLEWGRGEVFFLSVKWSAPREECEPILGYIKAGWL